MFINTHNKTETHKKRLERLKRMFEGEEAEEDNPYDNRAIYRHMHKKENDEVKELKKDRKEYFEPYKKIEQMLRGVEPYKPLEYKDYMETDYEMLMPVNKLENFYPGAKVGQPIPVGQRDYTMEANVSQQPQQDFKVPVDDFLKAEETIEQKAYTADNRLPKVSNHKVILPVLRETSALNKKGKRGTTFFVLKKTRG